MVKGLLNNNFAEVALGFGSDLATSLAWLIKPTVISICFEGFAIEVYLLKPCLLR